MLFEILTLVIFVPGVAYILLEEFGFMDNLTKRSSGTEQAHGNCSSRCDFLKAMGHQ